MTNLLDLPLYNEGILLKRADRFAKLVQLNAPTMLLLNEYKLLSQSMLAAIGESESRISEYRQTQAEPPESTKTQESTTQEPSILDRLFRRKS